MMSYILIMCTFAPPKSEKITGTANIAKTTIIFINNFIIQNFLNQKQMKKFLFLIALFTLMGGGVNSVFS